MGKGFSSFLDFFKIDDDEYEEEEYEEEQHTEEKAFQPAIHKKAKKEPAAAEEDLPKRMNRSRTKVVPMTQTAKTMEVNIIKPTSFEDSQEICNTLLHNQPVVVNLEGFDSDDAQRIMDFILGCIFAINGKFHPISKYIFIFSPENVDISGDSISLTGEGLSTVPTINREF